MPSNSYRTPFDDELVNDPGAPRDTQPLKPPASRATGLGNRPSSLPPQVVPATTNGAADDDAFPPQAAGMPSSALTPLTRRIPLGTLIGLAMAAGALGVIVVSAIVGRVIPRPEPAHIMPKDAPPSLPLSSTLGS